MKYENNIANTILTLIKSAIIPRIKAVAAMARFLLGFVKDIMANIAAMGPNNQPRKGPQGNNARILNINVAFSNVVVSYSVYSLYFS